MGDGELSDELAGRIHHADSMDLGGPVNPGKELCSRGTVTCSIGDLAAGATATVTIVVTPTGKPGTLANTATVTATNVTDSPDSDDSATATVTVHGT